MNKIINSTINKESMLAKTNKFRMILRDIIFTQKNNNTAFELAKFYGSFSEINPDGFLNDDKIVDSLFKRISGDSYLSQNIQFKPNKKNESFAHIVTRTYNHGGHCQLLFYLVKGLQNLNFKQKIFFSQSMDKLFEEKISKLNVEICGITDTLILGIKKLVSNCEPFSTIVLHIHPNDIIAAVAATILKKNGKKVLFVDHADHSFAYGRENSSVVMDVSKFGWDLNKNLNSSNKHSYLGIPVDESKFLNKSIGQAFSANNKNDRIFAVTIGRPSKYQSIDGLSFSDFINQLLLSNNKIEFHIIGSNGSEKCWSHIDKKYRSRVKFLGVIPRYQIDSMYPTGTIYVDSFPISGATAMTDAFAAGFKVYGLNFRCGGYNFLESLYDDSFISLISSINSHKVHGKLSNNYEKLRRNIIDNFSITVTTRRLIDASNQIYHIPPRGLNCDANRYDVYQLPWLNNGQIRFPYDTFINIPITLKLFIFFNFICLCWNHINIRKIYPYLLWFFK